MFCHVIFEWNDIERSGRSYDAVFTAIAGKPGRTYLKGLVDLRDGAPSW